MSKRAQRPTYLMGAMGFFHRGKAARSWSWPLTFI